MQEKFIQLKEKAKAELETITSSKVLFDVKAKYVGKSGEVTALLRGMKEAFLLLHCRKRIRKN